MGRGLEVYRRPMDSQQSINEKPNAQRIPTPSVLVFPNAKDPFHLYHPLTRFPLCFLEMGMLRRFHEQPGNNEAVGGRRVRSRDGGQHYTVSDRVPRATAILLLDQHAPQDP